MSQLHTAKTTTLLATTSAAATTAGATTKVGIQTTTAAQTTAAGNYSCTWQTRDFAVSYHLDENLIFRRDHSTIHSRISRYCYLELRQSVVDVTWCIALGLSNVEAVYCTIVGIAYSKNYNFASNDCIKISCGCYNESRYRIYNRRSNHNGR
jgi:hypothetical protein